MRLARIHIYFGTAILPDRNLGDEETGHDSIEVEIGENEQVKEVELVKQGPAYERREETDAEFEQRTDPDWQDEVDRTVRQLGGTRVPTSLSKKMVNVRKQGYSSFRYRFVTLEEIDHVQGDDVTDAEVVGELPAPE